MAFIASRISCRAISVIALMAALLPSTAAVADSSAATQMLPPTIAGSTSSSGCGANSVLSLNMGATTGSAINCTPTIIDSNGDLSAPGFGSFGGNLTTNGTLTVSSPIGTSGATHYAVNVATNGRMASGDLTKGGNGGLWVADSASTASGQFFGSMDAQHVGIWNKPAGVANGAQYWRLAVDSAGNVGIDNQNPQFPLDVTGNANVSGTATVSGATISSSTVITANNLAAAGSCSANYALTKNSDGTFACVQVTDLVGVGKVTVPSCTANQYLSYSSANGFQCDSLPAAPTGSCSTGQVVTYSNGAYSCTTLPVSAPVPTSCPDGDVLQYSASAAAYQCVAPSTLASGTSAGTCPAGWYVPVGAYNNAYSVNVDYCGGNTHNGAGVSPSNECLRTQYTAQFVYIGTSVSSAVQYAYNDLYAMGAKIGNPYGNTGWAYGPPLAIGVSQSDAQTYSTTLTNMIEKTFPGTGDVPAYTSIASSATFTSTNPGSLSNALSAVNYSMNVGGLPSGAGDYMVFNGYAPNPSNNHGSPTKTYVTVQCLNGQMGYFPTGYPN